MTQIHQGSRMERECRDFGTLGISVAVIVLTWELLLGWSWPLSLVGADELSLPGAMAIREMVASGEGWSSVVYRPDILGGVKVANVNGRFPLYSLGAWLGLGVETVAVLAVLVVHALLGALAVRTAEDVTVAWTDGRRRLTALERVAVVWLCAFAPALGWRFAVGHLNFVIGLLPFAAALALAVACAARTASIALVAVSAAAIMLGLLHVGQQVVLYGVVFGAPLLLGICMTIGAGVKRLALPTLVVIGATLMALPALWGILAQAHSSDSPRILGGTSVTYGFITSSAADWLASLPWIRPSPSTEFRSTFAHEINYPVGPLLVLLVLLPFRRAWSIVIALAVSAVAVVAFSMDLAPVSRALLSVVPPLNLFRVPARAALVWLWVLPIVGVAAALHREGTQPPALSRWKTLAPWLAIPLGSVLLLLPAAAREIFAAALIVIVVVQTRWRRNGVPVAVGLVVLGLLSVASFADRLFTFYDLRSLFATADRIGVAVRAANPALASALTRVHLAFEIRPFAANTAFVAGLSTLDGYAVPTRRFSTLVSALRGERYEPTANFFRFTPGDAALTPLRQIYNVTHTVALPEPRSLVITPLGPTAGAAWFSAKSVRADNVSALAKDLRAPGDTLHATVREILWFDTSDPLTVSAPAPRDVDGRCGEARVTAVTASRHRQEITADVATAVKCPLTFATNFTEDLTAVAELESGVQLVVPVFPGYGALASVVVPAAARRITLLAQPVRLPWALMWVVAGLICCTGAAWLITSGNAGAELAGDTRCGRATQSA